MKNYNYLTKKEIDELIAEYEEEKMRLLVISKSARENVVCRISAKREKPTN
jgi:hypothetical protein